MKIRLRYIALFLLLAFGVPGIVGAVWFSAMVQGAGPLQAEKIVYIPSGSSIKKIARVMEREGALEAAWAFSLAARLQRDNGALKAGEFALQPGMSINALVALLQSGKTYQRRITIAEGLTSAEIIALVNAAEVMTGEIADVPPEGSLLPETYSYSHGDARQALVGRMVASMDDTLGQLWETRAENLPLKTPDEALVLASIVEKETGISGERKRVAGVFINRLKKSMPLQSDPTVIYALTQGKAKLERALTFKDLKFESLYNTYVVGGLPPGPIANPGREAIAAVLQPEEHDFLYFVADGTGGHAFSPTLEGHNRNVAAWRKINSKN